MVSSNALDEFRRAATMTRQERERALLVWVRQSEWVLSNAIAVRGEGG
jgi:hypothetical protein